MCRCMRLERHIFQRLIEYIIIYIIGHNIIISSSIICNRLQSYLGNSCYMGGYGTFYDSKTIITYGSILAELLLATGLLALGASNTPLPKYSLIIPNPSCSSSNCLKNRSCWLALLLMLSLISFTLRYSAAHLGHSFSLSGRHLAWKECMHRKCIAGRDNALVH